MLIPATPTTLDLLKRPLGVFLVVGFCWVFDSCAIYTKEELAAAERRTNDARAKVSDQVLNENLAKFRKNYFVAKKLDTAAEHEDLLSSRAKSETTRAAKDLQQAKQDEDDTRALCCKN